MSGVLPIPRGGSGGGLSFGTGQLSGYTNEGSAGSGPPDLLVEAAADGVLTISIDGISYVYTFATSDPSDGTTWVDTSGLFSLEQYGNALIAALNPTTPFNSGFYSASYDGGGIVRIAALSAYGSTYSTGAESPTLSVSGGGSGADDVPASGQVDSIELISATAGKTPRPVSLGVTTLDGLSANVEIGFKDGPTFHTIASFAGIPAATEGLIFPIASYIDTWFSLWPGYSLHAVITSDIPVGGYVKFWAVAEKS